jgi:hypothetical protein
MNHAAIFILIANFDRRNQYGNQKESCTEEESRRKEEEVAAASIRTQYNRSTLRPRQRGLF